jgi:GNAT superfamily N-acetyltransferase
MSASSDETPSSVDAAFLLRSYRPQDRARIRQICAETAWAGEAAGDKIPSAFFWSELMTHYFTDVEPAHAWIVERASDRSVEGYLLGASDVALLEVDRLKRIPRLMVHAIFGRLILASAPRRTMASMARALVRGELVVPAKVRERFPATFAMAMRHDARGRGLGALLLDRFLTTMRETGRPGAHVQTTSINDPILRIIQRAGFQLAAEWPLTAFEGAGVTRLSLLTWVLPL